MAHRPAAARRSGGLDHSLALIRRRGATAVALGRWAAVLRALVPGAAGISGMTQTRFTVANVLGGTLWATAIAVAGYLLGASYHALERDLGLAGNLFAAGVFLLAIGGWLRTRRRSAQADPGPAYLD